MENILSLIKSAYEFAEGLDIEQITLLSVLVTLIIFVFDRRKDTKNVQLEARREQYKKFILLLQKSLVSGVKQDEKTRSEFFDVGVSLLLYGSKKVYKKYVFFREYTTNPIIQKSEHNKKEVLLYVIADILKTITLKKHGIRWCMVPEHRLLQILMHGFITRRPVIKKGHCVTVLLQHYFAVMKIRPKSGPGS